MIDTTPTWNKIKMDFFVRQKMENTRTSDLGYHFQSIQNMERLPRYMSVYIRRERADEMFYLSK